MIHVKEQNMDISPFKCQDDAVHECQNDNRLMFN